MALQPIVTGTCRSLQVYFLCLEKRGSHYADEQAVRLCVVGHCLKIMLAIKLYIFALTLLFLILVIASRSLGVLEAVVISCAILYLIIDAKSELKMVQAELKILKDLEERIAVLLRS
jgi:hypothetical protein